jgi:hypothetical protein
LFESTAKQRLARRMPLRLVPRCDPWSCELQHRPSKYGSHLVSSAAHPAAPIRCGRARSVAFVPQLVNIR